MNAFLVTLVTCGISALGVAQTQQGQTQQGQVQQGQVQQGQVQQGQVQQGQVQQGQVQQGQVQQGQVQQGQVQQGQVQQGQTQQDQDQRTQTEQQHIWDCRVQQGQTQQGQHQNCSIGQVAVLDQLNATQSCFEAHEIIVNSYQLAHTSADAPVMARAQQICMNEMQERCGVTDQELTTQISSTEKLCALLAKRDGLKHGAAASYRAVCNADYFHGLYLHLQE
jgi:hypothetical protein